MEINEPFEFIYSLFYSPRFQILLDKYDKFVEYKEGQSDTQIQM